MDPVCLQLKRYVIQALGPSYYPMILKLLITRGNITLIPKDATQEKEKEILKSQPEKLNKKEK